MNVCILSAHFLQTSRLDAEDQCTGMAAIMMYADTKKDVHTSLEIHYNTSRHEHTPRGEGASEGCRPKLPRWPFSASGCTQASGTAVHGSMVGSHAWRVKLFSMRPRIFGAPQAESLVVALLPPASVLVPSRLTDPSSHTSQVCLCVHTAS